jgi:hypothetical protein
LGKALFGDSISKPKKTLREFNGFEKDSDV